MAISRKKLIMGTSEGIFIYSFVTGKSAKLENETFSSRIGGFRSLNRNLHADCSKFLFLSEGGLVFKCSLLNHQTEIVDLPCVDIEVFVYESHSEIVYTLSKEKDLMKYSLRTSSLINSTVISSMYKDIHPYNFTGMTSHFQYLLVSCITDDFTNHLIMYTKNLCLASIFHFSPDSTKTYQNPILSVQSKDVGPTHIVIAAELYSTIHLLHIAGGSLILLVSLNGKNGT